MAPGRLDGLPWIIDAQPAATASVERFLARARVLGFVPMFATGSATSPPESRWSPPAWAIRCCQPAAQRTLAHNREQIAAIELSWLGLTLSVHAVTLRRPSRAVAQFLTAFTG